LTAKKKILFPDGWGSNKPSSAQAMFIRAGENWNDRYPEPLLLEFLFIEPIKKILQQIQARRNPSCARHTISP
jgi:hypothetical protein